jgi:endonuclease YncB( thermonuclease family)
MISEKEVQCEIVDIDRYKRFVAKCFVKNINLNQYMVQNGWAIAYRYYSDDFINEEEIAEKNKAGIWQGKFQDPYLFRKQQKN